MPFWKNMDILLDTNVLMNFITGREDPHHAACEKVMELCSLGRFTGYVAFHSLSTIWYVIRWQKSEAEARFWLDQICNLLVITGASQPQVIEAINNRDFKDFEDCLQDECAVNVNADFIVTCNAKDFVQAKTKTITPDMLVSLLEE